MPRPSHLYPWELVGPAHDPAGESVACVARRLGHRIRPGYLLFRVIFRVRVVALGDVGVVVGEGVDDERVAVGVEEVVHAVAVRDEAERASLADGRLSVLLSAAGNVLTAKMAA